jgi:hypothetical protein
MAYDFGINSWTEARSQDLAAFQVKPGLDV